MAEFKPLTPEEHLENPDVCPFCGSEEIQANDEFYEYKAITQVVTCMDCEKSWNEHYTLTSFTHNESSRID